MIRIDLQIDDVEPKGDVGKRVSKVFQSLDKYTKNFKDGLKNGRVRIMKRSRWGYKILFDMKLPGKTIFAEGKGKDLMKIAHEVKESARRQISRYKDKLDRR